MSHVILGGGISGLSTAFYLIKKGGYGIKIFESANRVGGWINSVKTKNGTLFELGPNSLRTGAETAENTLNLAEEIGLKSLIIPVPRTSEAAKKRLMYVNNQLVSFPDSFTSLFRIKPPYMKPLIFAFVKDLKTPKQVLDDDSVYNFVARRFGEGYAKIPASALMCGIFAGDAREISVKAVMGELFKFEQKYDSVIRGAMKSAKKKKKKFREELYKWSAWSFQDGLQILPTELKHYLEKKRVEVLLEKPCSNIVFKGGKAVLTIDGQEEIANHVYSSLPSKELARILGAQHPFLKNELSSIPFVNVAVVNLEYDGDLIKNKSFGFLVPPDQNIPVLGIIYVSCIFPQAGKTNLTVMMGGRWFEQHFGSNPEEGFLLQTAVDHVRKILKIDAEPSESRVNVLRNCLPQYTVGHFKKVENIRAYIAEKKLPLTLIGNSFDGVGIHDAIMSAKKNVESVSLQAQATVVM